MANAVKDVMLFLGYVSPPDLYYCGDSTDGQCLMCGRPVKDRKARWVSMSRGNQRGAGVFRLCRHCDEDVKAHLAREFPGELPLTILGDDLIANSRWLVYFRQGNNLAAEFVGKERIDLDRQWEKAEVKEK